MTVDEPAGFDLTFSLTAGRHQMTEEEWLSDETSGRLLEHTKRIAGLTPKARGRKYRLAGVEIVRELLRRGGDDRIVPVVEAAEKLYEEQAALRDVVAAARGAGVWPSPWGSLADHLAADDAFSGLRGVAGATQDALSRVGPPARVDVPEFVAVQCRVIREVFGNPFRPAAFSPSWRTDTAVALARQMYEGRDFSLMPILADALQDAGCDDEEMLRHCRDASQVHVRGCWVVDLVLGKV
jgi:hypothetical protein